MTYIDILNKFHRTQRHGLSLSEIGLYSILLDEANKSFWKPEFSISDADLRKAANISSHHTLNKIRENLAYANLIRFSTKKGSSKVVYSIVEIVETESTLAKNANLSEDSTQQHWQKMPTTLAKNANNIGKKCQPFEPTLAKNANLSEAHHIYSKDSFKDINKDSFKTENFEKNEFEKIEKNELKNSFVEAELGNQTKGGGAASFENQTNLEIPESLDTPEFVTAWGDLLKTKRFAKRTEIALKTILNELAVYPSNFAISLIKTAIMGEYGNVIYPDTPQKFEAWKKSQINAQDAPVITPVVTQNAVPAETKKTVARVVKPSW